MTSSESVSAFTSVDNSGDHARLFNLLDLQARVPAIVSLRSAAAERLAVTAGASALDVGCGLGETTRDLAARVAPGGHVVGVDLSAIMIDEAKRRTPAGVDVAFETGDATALRFEDESFDAVRCERTLQHVPETRRAFDELVRVTRRGGRLAVIDTDWDTAILSAGSVELERRLRTSLSDGFACGTVARRLPGWFREAGFDDVTIEPATLVFTQWDEAGRTGPPISLEVRRGVEAGAITAAEGEAVLAEAKAQVEQGSFFSSVTTFLFCGTRR